MRIAATVGAAFGMYWAIVPSRQGLPTAVWAAGIAVVAMFGIVGVRLAGRAHGAPGSGAGFARNPIYWGAVIFEVVVIAIGQRFLEHNDLMDYQISMVLIAVGVHFFPLSWAVFGRWNPVLGSIGVALTLCGVLYAAGRAAGAPEWTLAVVGGELPALSLTALPLAVSVLMFRPPG